MAIITAKAVEKTHKSGVHALKGVNLELDAGQRLSLLGPNGAGKSTLVRILTGLSRRDGGVLEVNGLDPSSHPRSLQEQIGVVLQEDCLDPLSTPKSLLFFQCQLFGMGKGQARHRAQERLHDFGLQAHQEKKVGHLSGGLRRRLHCALALLHAPTILFLDEPSVGLDPESRQDLWTSLDQVLQSMGTALILTTHSMEEAQHSTQDVVLLVDGQVGYKGSIQSFLQGAQGLEQRYLDWMNEWKECNT
ncbi:MAG: ABC transporter ATP-binding protein [Spirochaetales bacterium]|nr:ABC transporter ATP-binding protein [Spirochaetales bacterium]